MIRLKFLSAALIAAAMLASPAMARESHVDSCRLAANTDACTPPKAQYRDGFRGHAGHDVWGHWGTYYGPLVPSIP
jgi:hypothetical protein